MQQGRVELNSPSGSAATPPSGRVTSAWHRLVSWLERLVYTAGDDAETRLRKVQFANAMLLTIPSGIAWGMIYAAFNEPVPALIPLGYAVLTLADFALFVRLRRFGVFQRAQLCMILVAPCVLQLSLGGFAASGAVIVWSFLAVLIAMVLGGEEPRWWLGAFLTAVVLAAVLQSHVRTGNNLPSTLVTVFFVLNIGGVAVTAFAAQESFQGDRRKLRMLEVAYLNQELMLRQSEKLATLGTLAAGVAHELNNPAAAVSRGVAQLRPLIESMQTASLEMWSSLAPDRAAFIEHVKATMRQASPVASLTPLERSDREDETADWLRSQGVDQPAEVASALVDLGYTQTQLEAVTAPLLPQNVPSLLSWLASAGATQKLLDEASEGAGRISRIVNAMRSYAYLDQAPVQDVDVVEGLEDTLVLLGGKLGSGVVVHREYEEGLPRIEAYGSELNQVWTNIIQNAIDAMDGSGNITLRALSRDDQVIVEIEDDGPGMTQETAAHVFDPFFTTKPPGKGTGLGLNISYNIVVQKHRGSIQVESEAGRTEFRVSLPVRAPAQLSA